MARAGDPGPTPGRLADCPESPNCVGSRASRSTQRVEPFPCRGSCRDTLKRLAKAIESMPGASIVASTDTYLRAEFTTLLFRFVDDLELLVDAERGVIDVRSASRVGTWDLGLNRRRVESLRRRLRRLQRPD